MDANEFLGNIARAMQKDDDREVRFATIDPAYVTGDPYVTFDGESTLSGKSYKTVGYIPIPSQRVAMLPAGPNSYIILGGVDTKTVTPPGVIMPYASFASAPTGWRTCNGAAILRSDYLPLFTLLNPVVGTFTITVAAPAVVTLTAHGMQTGQQVYLTTTGALPIGLTANTNYWIVRTGANTFNLSTTLANALAGTKITTTGTQSGVHTLRMTWGVGDGSTTFNLPDFQGKFLTMYDTAQTEFASRGIAGGSKTHSHALSSNGWALIRIISSAATILARIKTVASWTATTTLTGTGNATSSTTSTNAAELSGATDDATALPPYAVVSYIIKT